MHCKLSTRRALTAFALALIGSLPVNALATIDPAPPSIVDHGSFITDLVAHRDWYKFSNPSTTIGLSFEDALTQFAPLGWMAASLSDVQALQGGFGWSADTATFSLNDNYGLTDAMASYLGYTATYFVDGGLTTDVYQTIQGVTSEAFFFGDALSRGVTTSETQIRTIVRDGVYLFGDFVDGGNGLLAEGASDSAYGVWLTRDSIPPTRTLPEPGSSLLLLVGLSGLLVRRRASIAKTVLRHPAATASAPS